MAGYPALLTAQDDDGYCVTFRDLPEVVAQGDTRDEARAAAVDAIAVALEFRIKDGESRPVASVLVAGEELIVLPALVEAKLALFRRMHETATSKTALARRLGVSEGAVRKLLRFDHRSHIGQIEAALHALGQRLEVHARDAA